MCQGMEGKLFAWIFIWQGTFRWIKCLSQGIVKKILEYILKTACSFYYEDWQNSAFRICIFNEPIIQSEPYFVAQLAKRTLM